MIKLKIIREFVLSIPFLMVFTTVFVINSDLANGIVSGKYFWFYETIVAASLVSLLSFFLNKNKTIRFEIIDWIVLLYSVSLSLFMPETDGISQKQVILPLTICLYFYFRFFLTSIGFARYYLILFFISTGLIESVIGLAQLYGLAISHHHLFKITGTFFNPGPYSGYVAMVAPMALYYAVSDRKILNLKYNKRLLPFIIRWIIAVTTIIASLLILPASMSRAAWLGLLLGSAMVIISLIFSQRKYRNYLKIHKRKLVLASCAVVIFLFVAFVGMYHLKKDSADGRILMWKISMSVISEHLNGTGLGTFPSAYGDAQAKYFEEGRGTEAEKRVAGNPEYAFNEYLQIGIEQGIIPLSLFLLLLFFAVYLGIKRRNIAATGSLISLAVFAFASYPFSVLPFLIGLTFLLALIAATKSRENGKDKSGSTNWMYWSFGTPLIAIFIFVTIYCVYTIYPTKVAYKAWNQSKILYQSGMYQDAVKKYTEVVPQLSDQVPFLFEYAQSLSKTEQYESSNEVLEKAMKISCDPMLYNIMGKNYQALKEYPKAEKCFLKSSSIVPNRMYPYYLLTKMYLESGQTEKAQDMARIVLTKEPKVHSTAVEEMRREIKKMLDPKDKPEGFLI